MSPSHERLLRRLFRIYRVMLLAYPSAFRREYRDELAMVFRDRARDAVQHGDSWALVPFVAHIAWDWLRSTLLENTTMTARMPLVRWLAALPLAMLAAYAAMRCAGFAIGFLVTRDFHHVWILASVGFFSMAAAFVAVGVWVVPNRKDSAARIAVAVVGAFGVYAVALGAFYGAFEPMSWGACMLLGGVAPYLAPRLHRPSQTRRALSVGDTTSH